MQENNEGNNNQGSESQPSDNFSVKAPELSLPKGGGAIQGIGEKFAANPVTGTGSLSIPIATSPGRSGFGPQLSLSYDSGSGSSTFGLGWSLSLPSITRKTNKGLPRYIDPKESDEFILSGSEDLVPVLVKNNQNWEREKLALRTVYGKTYHIQRYKPRIEGLFAQIEYWINETDKEDCFWRSISRDNITTWYGKTEESRIFDPDDKTKIFSWLICETHDDKGNVIIYEYKAEDSTGINLSQVNEKSRTEAKRSANRYIKHIKYGNLTPYYPDLNASLPVPVSAKWMFEVVFDYGEHDQGAPNPNNNNPWTVRNDPFSTYRSGFEIRTYRLCQRVLMFHHFPDETNVGENCLVRSTDFNYHYEQNPEDQRKPIHSVIDSVSQCGYKKTNNTYLKKTLPPVEFDYSQVVIGTESYDVEPDSIENLPSGVDGSNYQWVDLDGEGLPSILTQQGGTWHYKRNQSPLTRSQTNNDTGYVQYKAKLGALETVTPVPSGGFTGVSNRQLLDLAGDGQIDLVEFAPPVAGFYERNYEIGKAEEQNWKPFQTFKSLPNIAWDDPNLKFLDLTGDGQADILITEDECLSWYPSLAEKGFGEQKRVHISTDEEKDPHVIFADSTQTIFQTDFSGDGLADIVRIRNGEICYWPNLGYGRFGSKVTMDNAPWFDHSDLFNPTQIRLVDIDGSGVTDIIYLGRNKTQFWFNQSGNTWSKSHTLEGFPSVDNLASVTAIDLLGNGTACLVWSSPLPNSTHAPMRYIELMAEGKPHLMIGSRNNLGAETLIHYAPSTYFYLKDKQEGKPWITHLPFPVHVVERVETYDHISKNRFVTRYQYHHGYFDSGEREFRGFGMVEQFDTEDFASLNESGELPIGENINEASHVPPIHTKTWFHTGAYLGRNRVSNFFAGFLEINDKGEYYRESGITNEEIKKRLLDDTILPDGLTLEEEREACRALKGMMLRQEVYAQDNHPTKATHPYTVTEQNFTIKRLQPQQDNQHAVFFIHPREAISYQYERNPVDPRTSHAMTLEVDDFGNVQKELAIAYGRRIVDPDLSAEDQQKQSQLHITYTENSVTNAINTPDIFRTPLPAETKTYELTGFELENTDIHFSFENWSEQNNFTTLESATEIPYENKPDTNNKQKRLIEHLRILYRPDDLGDSTGDSLALLPVKKLESKALTGESYKLAITSGLLAKVYTRKLDGQIEENLLPNPANVLQADISGGEIADRGGYIDLDNNSHWWLPSGRMFYSPNDNPTDSPAQELAYAQQHFFTPHRYRDPFGTNSIVTYDDYQLLITETSDALNNRIKSHNDYRVLQPYLVTDPNLNQTEVAFDILGMVVGTAIMGKILPAPVEGDSLQGFNADLSEADILAHINNPLTNPHTILNRATTRLVYDLFAYLRSKDQPNPQATVVYTLARKTHDTELNHEAGELTKIQHNFSYSDGFGREIQKKIQAEAGVVPQRDQQGRVIIDDNNRQPVMTASAVSPRWVGSGWTIFNNKGKPIRQYEPFFTDSYHFEFDIRIGVSPIFFYDSVERVVATLHPNHTWEKVIFDPWQQEIWDVNDTALEDKPHEDKDVKSFFQRLDEDEYLPTWYQQRQDGSLGTHERTAALNTTIHANTPTIAYADSLGRTFLTIAHNKFKLSNAPANEDPKEEFYNTRIIFDIEGNQREVIDALDRIVMRYDYGMLGNSIHQSSMEAGERWMLNDIGGNPIRAWDSRKHQFRTNYDLLRRPQYSFLTDDTNLDVMVEKSVYGESRPNPEINNLRGQTVELYDQAGVVTTERFDFKGNLKYSQRQLAKEYKTTLDWSGTVPLEANIYTSETHYDALNRPTELVSPDNSRIHNSYNEANLLERVSANLQGAATSTTFVKNIDYDAKGQRQKIDYGNGASTHYQYDPQTFRLTHLLTQRKPIDFPDDCPQPARTGWPGCQIQNLHYTYDPVGNISHIQDDAQQTIFFRNRRVEPSNNYLYDATYRLIEATGREHLGQAGSTPIPHSHSDSFHVGLIHPSDGNAMGTYLERYVYDAVGNFLEMQHRGTDPSHSGWTRGYIYNETSLIEPTNISNRLSSTTVANGSLVHEPYSYDAHGNMINMNHLSLMRWDYRDQLQTTARQVSNNGTLETTYYVYDSGGQRIRKITELGNGNRKSERIYFGGFETYYQHSGANAGLVRKSLHITDDKRRIALIDIRNGIDDGTSKQLIKYQFGNHIGSVSQALDDRGKVISFEEYTPYGSTSFLAVGSQIEIPNRYRFTGKENDEENGAYYHGARYYIPWLCRWLSSDPTGLKDGLNVYTYVSNRPVTLIDSNGTNGHPSPLNFSSFEEFAEAADEQAQSTVSRDELHETWGEAVDTDASGRSVRDVTAAAQLVEARQFQQDLHRVKNVRTPFLAFIMPAHIKPYLRDQSAGIQHPYLRSIARVNQSAGMASAHFTRLVAAGAIITFGVGMVAAPIITEGIGASALIAGGTRLALAYRTSSLFISANYARIVTAVTTGGAASRNSVVRTTVQNVWQLNPFQRGRALEAALIRVLPGRGMLASNFPTIDSWVRGANNMASRITSIKSIDLSAQSYQRGNAVFNIMSRYINKLSNFSGRSWGGEVVRVGANTARHLEVIIPPNIATTAQLAQLQRAAQLAQQSGITLNIRVGQ